MESASPDIPRRLPRGTHGLDRDVVEASQRTRLLEAVGRAVAERGYARRHDRRRRAPARASRRRPSTSTSPTSRTASWPPTRRPARSCSSACSEAHASHDDWLERTRAGIVAYLRWLAAEPALARVFLIEVAAAGPRALERREALRDRYAELMRERRGDTATARACRSRSSTPWWRRSTTWSCATSASSGAEDLPELEPVLRLPAGRAAGGPGRGGRVGASCSSRNSSNQGRLDRECGPPTARI